MKLWELRSYDQVIQLEQDRLVYQARLRARYGRAWRRRAPVDAMMPLRLARYGVPLAKTAPAGLAAAGIELPAVAAAPVTGPGAAAAPRTADVPDGIEGPVRADIPGPVGEVPAEPVGDVPAGPVRAADPAPLHETPAAPVPEPAPAPAPEPAPEPAPAAQLTVPVGPGRSRPLGNAGDPLPVPEQRAPAPRPAPEPDPQLPPDPEQLPPASALPDDVPRDEAYYTAYRMYVAEKNDFPDSRQFGRYLLNSYGVTGRDGGPLSDGYLRGFVREFQHRFRMEMENEHIP
ncbi:hypothetical protein [Streptomyces sp. NPDC048637]|uniref:hypothetical protein n=1 Tax=Streptomyces sp. NPDC048637 TaxID=3155636 RepID=UPI0034153885